MLYQLSYVGLILNKKVSDTKKPLKRVAVLLFIKKNMVPAPRVELGTY